VDVLDPGVLLISQANVSRSLRHIVSFFVGIKRYRAIRVRVRFGFLLVWR
jgi:hypothetical protein